MKGWVYVMSNPSLSGMVKIGYSMKDPHMRAGNDFDPAGLPDDYIVEYHALVDNPRAIEQQVHTRLKDQRYKKEWFRVTVPVAIANIRTVTSLCGEILLEQMLHCDFPATQTISIQNNFLSDQKLNFLDGLASFCRDGKWGYVDTGLNVVIPTIYDGAGGFSEGFAAVKIIEKYGYVDKQGRFILPPLYDHAFPFKSGLAPVQMGEKWGFINRQGDFLVPPYLDEAYPFATGMAPVRAGSDCYLIDTSGHRIESQPIDSGANLWEVHSFHYTSKKPLTVSGHIIKRKGVYGLIDVNGAELIPFVYERITRYANNLGRLLLCNKNKKVGIISDSNEVVLPLDYDSIEEIEDSDRAFLIKDGKWGLIDADGAIVVDPTFENDVTSGYEDHFVDGLLRAMIGGKYGWVDSAGKFVIAPKYDYVGNFYNGRAVIRVNDGPHTSFGYGYIDKNGSIVVSPSFFMALDFQDDGLAFVNGVIGGKSVSGYIDKSGVLVRSALHPDQKSTAYKID